MRTSSMSLWSSREAFFWADILCHGYGSELLLVVGTRRALELEEHLFGSIRDITSEGRFFLHVILVRQNTDVKWYSYFLS
jgi:hypothetical protein